MNDLHTDSAVLPGSDLPDTDALINERKRTSPNYRGWQDALALRDRIYREIGSGNSACDRVRVLIKGWHARWEAECREIDAAPSADTLALLEEAERQFDLG